MLLIFIVIRNINCYNLYTLELREDDLKIVYLFVG